MQKDFDSWNKIKNVLDTKEQKFFFKEGEIWWMSVGLNVAKEVKEKLEFLLKFSESSPRKAGISG